MVFSKHTTQNQLVPEQEHFLAQPEGFSKVLHSKKSFKNVISIHATEQTDNYIWSSQQTSVLQFVLQKR